MKTQERPQQADKIALNFDLFQNELKTHGFAENPLKAYEEFGNYITTFIVFFSIFLKQVLF